MGPGEGRLEAAEQGFSCYSACGVIPDERTNLCPLNWQILNIWATIEVLLLLNLAFLNILLGFPFLKNYLF